MGLKNWNKGCNSTVTFCENQQKLIYAIGFISSTRPTDLLTEEELGREINIKRTTTAYHLSKLRNGGLVEMPARGVYRLTALGQKMCGRIKEQEYIVRQKYRPHNILLVMPLLRPPKNYEELKTS